jgi:hypothetical protein
METFPQYKLKELIEIPIDQYNFLRGYVRMRNGSDLGQSTDLESKVRAVKEKLANRSVGER